MAGESEATKLCSGSMPIDGVTVAGIFSAAALPGTRISPKAMTWFLEYVS